MYDDDERYYARLEARREAVLDWLDEHGYRCADCGETWDPGYHSATRFEPAYVERDCCPNCGGEPADV